jgi:ABC-2 family transporter protein
MIWLTWRQFRVSALLVSGALAVMAILLAVTPQGSELASCVGQQGCPVIADKFVGLSHYHLLQFLSTLLVGLPALIGAFWGAPLITRELESGTYRLAWTQSVTRSRWLAVKISVIAVAGAAACGVLSLMLMRWSSDSINRDRLQPTMFAERGIVPIAYAVFALALGVVAGLLIRRTVPAMAATLVAFLGTRIAVQFGLRAHLIPASHLVASLTRGGLGIERRPSGTTLLLPPSVNLPGAWTLSTRLVDDAGHAPSPAFLRSFCGGLAPPPAPVPGQADHAQAPAGVQRAFEHCANVAASRFHEVATYQPASHYWPLQWAETGVYLGLAAALIGFAFWWTRHRLS